MHGQKNIKYLLHVSVRTAPSSRRTSHHML